MNEITKEVLKKILALEDTNKKLLKENEEFKKVFGNYADQADQWREDRIFIGKDKSYATKEPTISAYGIGGNLTGSHFNIAILDDVASRDNIGTKDQIEKVLSEFHIIPLNSQILQESGSLKGYLRARGITLDLADCIIGTTAKLMNAEKLITRNIHHFQEFGLTIESYNIQ